MVVDLLEAQAQSQKIKFARQRFVPLGLTLQKDEQVLRGERLVVKTDIAYFSGILENEV
jgi:hypothetical protein